MLIKKYKEQHKAAKRYYEDILTGCKRAVAVDIGWAGSGAMTLRHLVEQEWYIPCEIIGLIAGTNTVHNSEPDASEPFLQSGKLVAYLYSQSHNRDLLKNMIRIRITMYSGNCYCHLRHHSFLDSRAEMRAGKRQKTDICRI